jgi:hypothetical protein
MRMVYIIGSQLFCGRELADDLLCRTTDYLGYNALKM